MIKFRTVGAIEVSKNIPVLTHTEDVKNYSFMTIDDELYFIDNTIVGDKSYEEGAVIPKGDFLRGFLVKALDGLELVVDEKHVTDGLSSLNVKDKLEAQEDGTLKKADSPKGIYFTVVAKDVTLTEKAVIVKVVASGTQGE